MSFVTACDAAETCARKRRLRPSSPEANAGNVAGGEWSKDSLGSLGFYLNALQVPGSSGGLQREPYSLSLADVFGDGRRLERWRTGPYHRADQSTPAADRTADRTLSTVPFPGIADALLANYMADYDETFMFEHCASLYQTSGRLVFLTGESPARLESQRLWVRERLGELGERTQVIGISGLFAERGALDDHRGASGQRRARAGGVHHSKFMVLRLHDNRVRLVIHTSNDIAYDWFHKCQGIFAVDLPYCGTGSSPHINAFGRDMQQYLRAYIQAGERALYRNGSSSGAFGTMVAPEDAANLVGAITFFCRILASCDYSNTDDIRLVASVPGWHRITSPKAGFRRNRSVLGRQCAFGHLRFANLVAECCTANNSEQRQHSLVLVLQCSSLSSIDAACTGSPKGASCRYWLTDEFLTSLLQGIDPSWPEQQATSIQIHLVWPTVAQVRMSTLGQDSGVGLIARDKSVRGPLLRPFLTRWNADWCDRTRVMPHIKTISCWDAQTGDCLYCYLGSANVTPAAWGIIQSNGQKLRCMNWELGVLFTGRRHNADKTLPEFVHWETAPTPSGLDERRPVLRFPLPYTIEGCAANRYRERADEPWCSDLVPL